MSSIGVKRDSRAIGGETSAANGEASARTAHVPRKTVPDVVLLIALGLLVTCPVLIYGAPDLSHDALDHARWAKQFATQFWQGDLYPRWFTNVNAGFGGPSGFYYPPLTSYVSAIFWPFIGAHDPYGWRAAGYALVLAQILSGLTAYWWLRSMVKPKAALAGAALYVIAPYHLAIDLYVRGASAEAWVFVWFPLVMLAAESLVSERRSRWALPGAAVSYGLAVLSHPTVALCFAPIPVTYVWLFSDRKQRVRATGLLAAALLVGVGLNAQYLMPAILDQGKAYVERQTTGPGDYRNQWLWQDNSEIAAMSGYVYGMFRGGGRPQLDLETLLKLPIVIATLATAVALGTLFLLVRRMEKAERLRRVALFYIVVAVASLLLTTKFSAPIWRIVPFLKFLQFPFRLNVFVVLSVALVAAVVISQVSFGGRRIMACFLLAIVVGCIGLDIVACSQTFSVWRTSTLNRQEITRGMLRTQLDFSTMWPKPGNLRALNEFSALDRFAAAHPPQTGKLEASPGGVNGGTVVVERWTPRRVTLRIEAPTDSRLTVNHFYYDGWQGRVKDEGTAIVATPSPDGLMQFAVPRGNYEFVVELPKDGPERVGLALSLFSLALLGGVVVMGRKIECSEGFRSK